MPQAKSADKKSGPETLDQPPAYFESEGKIAFGRKKLSYQARAGWLPLYDKDKVRAEIFHTYYRATGEGAGKRPLTFVFNGGPGAASAYLHVGAIGPKRVKTNADGTLPAPPTTLVDNPESWLAFSDLVFIDPVATGLSRSKSEKDDEKDTSKEPDTFYWDVANDLTSLCNFMSSFLSKENLWQTPIYLAGESYGGYRAARLARMLQEKAGIGLNGVILISPALEWDTLFAGRFNTYATAHLLPSMAASARFHGVSSEAKPSEDLPSFLARVEKFALGTALPGLSLGSLQSKDAQKKLIKSLAAWIGLKPEVIDLHDGKINFVTFDKQKVLGWYDAAMMTDDPFPATTNFEGIDPTLAGLNRVYTAGANAHIRDNLGVKSERKYELLNYEVNEKWQWRNDKSGEPYPPGATDDLAAGMGMNPDMKVVIVHGAYDLVTPYFTSKYLAMHLARKSSPATKIDLKNYEGGHMFYMWEKSRKAFFKDIKALFAS